MLRNIIIALVMTAVSTSVVQADPVILQPGSILDHVATSPAALQQFWESEPAIRNFVGLSNDAGDDIVPDQVRTLAFLQAKDAQACIRPLISDYVVAQAAGLR